MLFASSRLSAKRKFSRSADCWSEIPSGGSAVVGISAASSEGFTLHDSGPQFPKVAGRSRRAFGGQQRVAARGRRALALSAVCLGKFMKSAAGKPPSVQPWPRFFICAKIFGSFPNLGGYAPCADVSEKNFAAKFLRGRVRTAKRLRPLTRVAGSEPPGVLQSGVELHGRPPNDTSRFGRAAAGGFCGSLPESPNPPDGGPIPEHAPRRPPSAAPRRKPIPWSRCARPVTEKKREPALMTRNAMT